MALHSWLARPQRRLGRWGSSVLAGHHSLVTPLSLDMYTPAVPHMTEHFNTSESMVNLTLVGYFLFFAVGLLAFGPQATATDANPCCWRAFSRMRWPALYARCQWTSSCSSPRASCKPWAPGR